MTGYFLSGFSDELEKLSESKDKGSGGTAAAILGGLGLASGAGASREISKELQSYPGGKKPRGLRFTADQLKRARRVARGTGLAGGALGAYGLYKLLKGKDKKD